MAGSTSRGWSRAFGQARVRGPGRSEWPGTPSYSHGTLVRKAGFEASWVAQVKALREQGIKQGPQRHHSQARFGTGDSGDLHVHLKALTSQTPKSTEQAQARVQVTPAQGYQLAVSCSEARQQPRARVRAASLCDP